MIRKIMEKKRGKRKEGVAVLTVENYALKRNGRDCSENLSSFERKSGAREESRFYTNCRVFKMARPPCKIILNGLCPV